jgi:sugar O-acyltransferase (sialic acid O-acetyltransferase NeuD family)
MTTKPLIIVGDSAFAEVAYELFTHDSEYGVVAFAVEQAYLTQTSLFGLPVVALETLEETYPPATHAFYTAMVYTQLNRLRQRLYLNMKARGYTPASYVSSRAFVWHNVKLGEHVFIFEDNTLQPFVEIGDNTVLWSGNHIGHHSRIGAHNFIASHVVVSGKCTIGDGCVFGVNATIGNDVVIGADCMIGAGAMVTRNVPENTLLKGTKGEVAKFTPRQYFKIADEDAASGGGDA